MHANPSLDERKLEVFISAGGGEKKLIFVIFILIEGRFKSKK